MTSQESRRQSHWKIQQTASKFEPNGMRTPSHRLAVSLSMYARALLRPNAC